MHSVVALYDQFADAQAAVGALREAGFCAEDINLVARDADTQGQAVLAGGKTSGASAGAGIGAVLGGLSGLLAGLGALAIPGIGPVLAAGPILTTLAGTGVGMLAGGIIGALMDLGIPEEHAHYFAEGIRRGGTLLIVHAQASQTDQAVMVLNRFSPVDIDERGQKWRSNWWGRFEQDQEPLLPDQMEFNRPPPGSPAGADQTDIEPLGEAVVADLNGNRGLDHHLAEDIYSRERANQTNMADIPVTGMPRPIESVEEVYSLASVTDDCDGDETEIQADYQRRYGSTGYGFDYYQAAYQYGCALAHDPRYQDTPWNQLEPSARREWRTRSPSAAWEDIRDAVFYAWRMTHSAR